MPRNNLTQEQIIKAAIYLLDTEGIKGLSMRRLGQVLGGATTATYWHVKNKESLLILAADSVWGEVKLQNYETLGWHKSTQNFARDIYTTIIRHPWLMTAMIEHNAYGSNRAKCQDHYCAILESAGLKDLELDAAVNTLLTFIFGTAFSESMTSEYAEKAAVDFPRLQARIADRGAKDADTFKAANFEFGLAVILTGLEQKIDS